jgi:diguanylate cyclase (GGDEF)-like protein
MKKASIEALAPRRALVAALVFLLAMGVTGLAYNLTRVTIRNAADRSFEQHVERVEKTIRDRMVAYEQVMRSGAAMFAGASQVTRKEWRRFVTIMDAPELYPGVRGVHFAPWVKADDLERHTEAVRAEGFPDYRVRPPGERANYVPLMWTEPLDERNLRVMGFDMLSEATRRDAIQRARDSGKSAITGKITLVGDAKNPVPGFVYYLPIYAPEPHPRTVAERRDMLQGFVLCPFRMPDLMAGTLGKEAEFLRVEVYDGVQPSTDNWLYDENHDLRALDARGTSRFWLRREIEFGGRAWSIYYEGTDKFVGTIDGNTPRLLLLVGGFMSLIATILTFRLLRAEAVAQAASMNDGLTNLYNRRYLEATLWREEARARRTKTPISIIQFDLDHFKKLNDTYGHAAGDEVLRAVAVVLRDETRGDDIACRYGGEEFTVIMPGATLATATERAEALRASVARLRLKHDGKPLPTVTVSGGVAVFPDQGSTLQSVLNKADAALILAKREGRARIKVAEATTSLN